MKDFGLVHDPIYDAYYVYLGNAVIGFDPHDYDIWAWIIEVGAQSYEEPEVKLLW